MRDKVLFVDNDKYVLAALERNFGQEDFECLVTSKPAHACEIMKREPVKVLFTELILPDMNGLELVEWTRRESPQTVRIILSGHVHSEAIVESLNRGDANSFVPKPWRIDEKARALVYEALGRPCSDSAQTAG